MTFSVLDAVRTKRAVNGIGLPADSIGTIVLVHLDGDKIAYEVEFADAEGVTLGFIVMKPEDLAPIGIQQAA